MDQTINPFSNGVTQAIWNGVPPNYIGSHGALITDVTTGYLYQKSGGIWNLVCNKGVVVLSQSAVPASVTGTTAETVLATITIPANAMGPNGSVRVTTQWTYTNSANTKTTIQRFAGLLARTVPLTTTNSRNDIFVLTNRNATNSQVGSSAGASAYGTSSGNSSTFSVDTTQAQNITLAGTLTNTGETITLESYLVEILNP